MIKGQHVAPRMLAAWLALIAAPPLLLLALGWLWVQRQTVQAREELQALRTSRLMAVLQPVGEWIAEAERRLQPLLDESSSDRESLIITLRREPLIAQPFVIAPDGTLFEPAEKPTAALELFVRERPWQATPNEQTPNEQSSTVQTIEFSAQSALPPPDVRPQTVAMQTSGPPPQQAHWRIEPLNSQWWSCFAGSGLQLIYYTNFSDGSVRGFALRRSAWLAQLISRLPETAHEAGTPETARTAASEERLQLVDQAGLPLYVWGSSASVDSQQRLAVEPLPSPLQSLQLELWAAPGTLGAVAGPQLWMAPVLAASALALSLLGVGIYALRSMTAELRNASQRVSFVNQVSHELRTPLTNIRLYAELLERELSEEPSAQRVAVIRGEAERLSRLISNVLQLAKHGSSQRRLRLEPHLPDELIDRVLGSFAPAWQQLGIEVERHRGAPTSMMLDSDVLEQILVNLLSNVQKYAAQGRWVSVASRQDGERLWVTVCDRGPGIPRRQRERIFEPFTRLDDRTTSAAGTGIGLTIARQLARAHGGDVVLQPSSSGACFELLVRGAAEDEEHESSVSRPLVSRHLTSDSPAPTSAARQQP